MVKNKEIYNAGTEQENNRILEECETLEKEKKKRWKKVFILCGVIMLLGIGVNVGMYIYFDKAIESYAQKLDVENAAKYREIEDKLGVGQP